VLGCWYWSANDQRVSIGVSLKCLKVNYEIKDKSYYYGPSWIKDESEKMIMGPFCKAEYLKSL